MDHPEQVIAGQTRREAERGRRELHGAEEVQNGHTGIPGDDEGRIRYQGFRRGPRAGAENGKREITGKGVPP